MGISASIANSSRKYRTNSDLPHRQKSSKHSSIEVGDELEDDTASVSSFRPSSPSAHHDARAFTLDTPQTKRRDSRNQGDRRSYNSNIESSYPGNRRSYNAGSVGRSSRAGNGSHSSYSVQDPSSRALVSQSASSVNGSSLGPVRTMRDVREFLLSNPELLAGKKNRQMRPSVESDLYGLSNNHRQMKTKQSVYMGLINPPVVYGVGVRPDNRQLRVDQKLYLNLVYPTIRPKEYHQRAVRSRPPLKQEGMLVMRKDDHSRQPNGYIKRPVPQMEVSRLHEPSKVMNSPESMRHERTILRHDASTYQGSRGQSQNVAKTTSKRTSNDYVDFPDIVEEPLTSRSVKDERRVLRDKQMNGFVKTGNPDQKIERQFSGRGEDDVVFTFNVDDLDLRKKTKKTEVPRFEHEDRRQVVPLYFRKSLAYNPKYEHREDLLSSPL